LDRYCIRMAASAFWIIVSTQALFCYYECTETQRKRERERSYVNYCKMISLKFSSSLVSYFCIWIYTLQQPLQSFTPNIFLASSESIGRKNVASSTTHTQYVYIYFIYAIYHQSHLGLLNWFFLEVIHPSGSGTGSGHLMLQAGAVPSLVCWLQGQQQSWMGRVQRWTACAKRTLDTF